MFTVFESEMLHRRKHWAEWITNLCRGRYLPVEVTALEGEQRSIYLGLLMRIHTHINYLVMEPEFGNLEPEVPRCAHKVQKARGRKRELVEKLNLKPLEARCRNPIKKCFQVS